MDKFNPQKLSVQTLIKNRKIFDLVNFNVNNFDELINKSCQNLNLEYEYFFSLACETQWGYMKVVNGKPVKTIHLLEINITSVIPINSQGLNVKGYLIKYSANDTNYNETEEYISDEDMRKVKLMSHFCIPPQTSKRNNELCNLLLKNIILGRVNNKQIEKYIDIGKMQGWNVVSKCRAVWETKNRYSESLYHVIPESILLREKATYNTKECKNRKEYRWIFDNVLKINKWLKILFLIRISSYMLTFASKYNLYFNQIINICPSEETDISLLNVMFDNVRYGKGDTLTLNKAKEIKSASCILNDAVLLINDITKIDEDKKREKGVDVLKEIVTGINREYLQIPVLVSSYAISQISHDLLCDFSILSRDYSISSARLSGFLEWHDAEFIKKIEDSFEIFIEIFDKNIEEILNHIPSCIPANRRNIFCILIATLRTYDEYFEELFEDDIEVFIIEKILQNYDETEIEFDEILLAIFGKCLNQEISSGKLHYIRRTKFIVFNKGSDYAVVDDENIYLETEYIKELAEGKMKMRSVNLLTDILKSNDYLKINDKNSKCYRFHVQNSCGEPYMLYTYGISLELINSDNRKILGLAGLENFLLNDEELKSGNILPLGIAYDGRYIGKDISYDNKSNDNIFVTGKSGKGKTFCVSNLIPSLATLGSRQIVFDVSGSFTHNELLRSLPENIVNTMFEFIELGEGRNKIPINLLTLNDCTNLPEKKRKLFSLISAAAGKIEKDVSMSIKGIISDMLKNYKDLTEISCEILCDTLKSSGKSGLMVYNLISSVLDDIQRIGCENKSWKDLFEYPNKIYVISLGDEVGDSIHSLLDILISSVFEWQRNHNTVPLTIVIDEIKDQNFSVGSPLHTIITQGRKFNLKLIGITQQYISNDNHAIDVMKEAGIKIFFESAKSQDRIAVELGYKNSADAGFSSMQMGEFILSCDCYNKSDNINEPVVIHCHTVKFKDTPLYKHFSEMLDDNKG